MSEEQKKLAKDEWIFIAQCIVILMIVAISIYTGEYVYFVSGYISHSIITKKAQQ